MSENIKYVFQHYLRQLDVIVSKTPSEVFSLSLAEGMPSLEDNAKIASDFVLRGYCPLVKKNVVSFFSERSGKPEVQSQISVTTEYLKKLPDIIELNEDTLINEKAGFALVELSPPLFIHQFILPNFIFHLSMVYAIAKANSVDLGKEDFDGIHSYPKGFSL